MARPHTPSVPLAVAAFVLAYLVPGAGHVLLRRPIRGLILFVVISMTFWTGIGLGGVMTVDARSERWWFMGQMLTGVNGIISWKRQEKVYREVDEALVDNQGYQNLVRSYRSQGKSPTMAVRPYVDAVFQEKGLALVAPTESAARAYSGVAGMLNLMCMFDVLLLGLMGIRGESSGPAGRKESA